jgi:hypothetical protein
VHLVGFTIKIYYDARTHERQIRLKSSKEIQARYIFQNKASTIQVQTNISVIATITLVSFRNTYSPCVWFDSHYDSNILRIIPHKNTVLIFLFNVYYFCSSGSFYEM